MELGFYSMADIAERTGRNRNTLYADLIESTCPKLESSYKLGNNKLYEPYAVEAWIPLYLQWVANSDGRLKAQRERRQREQDAAYQARIAREAKEAEWQEEQRQLVRQSEAQARERAEHYAAKNPPQPVVFLAGDFK